MTTKQNNCAESMLSRIASEVESLREAILARNCKAIEDNSQSALKLLDELRPVLTGKSVPITAAVLDLRNATQRCAAVIKHMHRSVKALLSLHHSVSDNLPESGVQI